jgi:hypothetical protein
MKNLIILLLFTNIIIGQVHRQNEDRYSIQVTTDNVVFQKGIFYGGVEFNAEFSNGIYVRPQIHYASLEDGYLETSVGVGINFTYEKTTEYNFKPLNYVLNHLNGTNAYGGIKLGVINRATTYPIFGYEAGIEFVITDTFRWGLRGSYDCRSDSDFYGGDKWVYNSQGYLKIIL